MDPVFCPDCNARRFKLDTPCPSVRDINKRDTTLHYLLNAFTTQSVDAFDQLQTILLVQAMIFELRRALCATLVDVMNAEAKGKASFIGRASMTV
jgi:hypothetical protein